MRFKIVQKSSIYGSRTVATLAGFAKLISAASNLEISPRIKLWYLSGCVPDFIGILNGWYKMQNSGCKMCDFAKFCRLQEIQPTYIRKIKRFIKTLKRHLAPLVRLNFKFEGQLSKKIKAVLLKISAKKPSPTMNST